MVFDEKKYTEDSIIKQLSLIQLHSSDGSAVDAGCDCIGGKHLHLLEGLAEEGMMTSENPKEKEFYENLANLARQTRKRIEEGNFDMHGLMREVMKEKYPEPLHHSSDNPGRKYHPYGLTECEKAHPHVLKKLASCIRKVEKREGCVSPYTDCPVNPVAVCRATVKCP